MAMRAEKFGFGAIFEQEYLSRHDPIYSQAQMEQFITEHFQNGLASGKKQAQEDIDAMNTHHLEKIHDSVKELTAIQTEMFETLQGHVSTVCREITAKMLPTLAQLGAIDEVLSIVDLAFKAHEHANLLKIHVGSGYKQGLTEKLKTKLSEGTEMSFTVLEDENLAPSECRIEWETGGVERLLTHIQAQVDCALERLSSAAEYRRQELHASPPADMLIQHLNHKHEP
jgi:flagellar biosynthesis/type III secretory pathway protein FliH